MKREHFNRLINLSRDAWLVQQSTKQDLTGKSIGFVDTNLGLDHALACVGSGFKVIYYIASGGAYPYLKDERSGDGFPGINKVECLTDAVACDVVAFMDCYFGRDADDLRKAGRDVYGPSQWWTEVENDRRKGWLRLEEMGVGVPDGVIVKGLKELLRYIRDNQGEGRKDIYFTETKSGTLIAVAVPKYIYPPAPYYVPKSYQDLIQLTEVKDNPSVKVFYIKTSKYRGSKETGGSVLNWVEALVSVTQGMFGPYLTDMEFLVQSQCPGKEFGVDAYVNGKMILRPYLFTTEEKGSGTVGKWVESGPLDDLLFKKVLPSLIKTDYRGMICFEFFIDDKGRLRVHDPCTRNSYPCSAIQAHRIKNYPEVICAVAAGKNIQIEVDEGYEAQVGLYTDEKDTWRPIRFPEEIRESVGFRRVVIRDKEYYYCPGDFVVATAMGSGPTAETAIDKANEVVKQIECSNSAYPGGFKEDVLKKIETLNSWPTDLKF